MNPKLTQRKQAKNIIPALHNNNRSEIKQSKVETTMMFVVIHRQNSTLHLKCYSVVHPLNFWQYRVGIHLKTCQQHLYTFLHAAWCLTEYVKDFCKMKNKMKILSDSALDKWTARQISRTCNKLWIPKSCPMQKILANIFLRVTLKNILCDCGKLQAPPSSGQYCSY